LRSIIAVLGMTGLDFTVKVTSVGKESYVMEHVLVPYPDVCIRDQFTCIVKGKAFTNWRRTEGFLDAPVVLRYIYQGR